MTATGEVVVFIVSRSGNPTHRRVLSRMSREDDQTICGDNRTSSDRYMLCWTDRDVDDAEVNRYVRHSGKHAEVLREHNVTVLDSHEMRTRPAAASQSPRENRQAGTGYRSSFFVPRDR